MHRILSRLRIVRSLHRVDLAGVHFAHLVREEPILNERGWALSLSWHTYGKSSYETRNSEHTELVGFCEVRGADTVQEGVEVKFADAVVPNLDFDDEKRLIREERTFSTTARVWFLSMP